MNQSNGQDFTGFLSGAVFIAALIHKITAEGAAILKSVQALFVSVWPVVHLALVTCALIVLSVRLARPPESPRLV